MKVAVFSDVQGILPALEVVVEDILRWEPDLVAMNGDLVNRGPRNLACLQLFQEQQRRHGWLPVKGNHEEYVLHCRHPPEEPIEAEMRQFADWTYRQMGDAALTMAEWPDHLTFSGPGSDAWVHVTHGSLLGNRRGISASLGDDRLNGALPEGIDLFVTAHTHKPLKRQFEGIRILNVGSVGSPFDGDVRASYGRLIFDGLAWHAEIVRLAYDRERAERDFHESGFLEQGGPLAKIIHAEWRRAELLMPLWKGAFQEAVLQGRLGLEEAVGRFLALHQGKNPAG
ncbi:MAG: metallophosphoesterase family protein [Gammaproteobacteria bacterium]|nr:metallophosphoesterase family protein [Gammaproteobacteria bacterium]MBU1655369.1 metallophosphoesterase family protein [Gammaproteobacteria bacterium]MBU1960211.1 metallophosphoesterase family protein [Gammaproteobacteria bacterium]